jgi:hypothetical protein
MKRANIGRRFKLHEDFDPAVILSGSLLNEGGKEFRFAIFLRDVSSYADLSH